MYTFPQTRVKTKSNTICPTPIVFFKIFMLLGIAILLSACGRSEPTSFYILESKVASPTFEYSAKAKRKMPKVVLQEVSIPAYLDRIALVNRQNNGVKVEISEFNSWSEDLDGGISRTLSAVLLDSLLKQNILLVPVSSDNDRANKLFIFIQRFDGQIGGQAVLDVRWLLQNSNSEALAGGAFSEKAPAGTSYANMAAAQSALLVKFGEHINGTIARAVRGKF